MSLTRFNATLEITGFLNGKAMQLTLNGPERITAREAYDDAEPLLDLFMKDYRGKARVERMTTGVETRIFRGFEGQEETPQDAEPEEVQP